MANVIANKYNFLLGTSRGIIFSTSCKVDEKPKYEIPSTSSEITALEWGRKENEVVVGYQNGTVALLNSLTWEHKAIGEIEGSDQVVGVGCTNNEIVIGRHDGIVNIWNEKCNEYFSLELDEKASLECLKVHNSRHGVCGTGGESNDFKLWDVNTQQCVFRAKSLGHDELCLPIPTSVRAIAFIPEDEHLSCCVTKQGHALLYDDRAQRRPVVKFLEARASYTSIASTYRGRQCAVGTTKGYIQLLDMRVGKCLKTFKSFTGSVTSIVCDPMEPYIASASLDRFLRVHNMETKELVYKNYMKQNLTKILMKPIIKEEVESVKQESVSDDEYEEMFNNMETVLDEDSRHHRKKRKSKIPEKNVKSISDADYEQTFNNMETVLDEDSRHHKKKRKSKIREKNVKSISDADCEEVFNNMEETALDENSRHQNKKRKSKVPEKNIKSFSNADCEEMFNNMETVLHEDSTYEKKKKKSKISEKTIKSISDVECEEMVNNMEIVLDEDSIHHEKKRKSKISEKNIKKRRNIK